MTHVEGNVVKKILQSFSVESLSVLNENGEADAALEPPLSSAQLRRMFEGMLLTREFDLRGISLQRQGKTGTYAPCLGQEAVHIGSAAAMEKGDWAAPSFREQGVYLYRGIKASTLFLFFMGSEEGNRLPRKYRTLPYCVPCATQILHAVGIGMAAKLKNDPTAVLAYFGDGATSEGDFHEGLNFAGVYQTPNVFVCQNNGWAISTPRSAQTHSPTLAQKAVAYGFPGLQLDGNDVLAVYRATSEALAKARSGAGPALLECMTYRMGVHTTSDDPARYRADSDLAPWKQRDPIDRFEKYLLAKGVLQPGDRKKLSEELAENLKREAAEAQEIVSSLSPDEMFTYMYANLPETLKPQMEEALQQRASNPLIGKAQG
jgi:pyruvate dehydrogenase E1 component, alpha subunit